MKVQESQKGTLYWVTGLSGSGKSTIAQALVEVLKEAGALVIFLDGDNLREVFGKRDIYKQEERLDLALQYARLCKMLTDQGLTVVCSTISLFKKCHQWNRVHILNYREIYLDVSMDILRQRDSKKIYSRADRGELEDVCGVDLAYEVPDSPDLIICNDGSREPEVIAKDIYEYYYNNQSI